MNRRVKLKEWRNGTKEQCTARIEWYGSPDGKMSVRLIAHDSFRSKDLYPESPEEAEKWFRRFQIMAPGPGSKAPVVEPLVDMIGREKKERRI